MAVRERLTQVEISAEQTARAEVAQHQMPHQSRRKKRTAVQLGQDQRRLTRDRRAASRLHQLSQSKPPRRRRVNVHDRQQNGQAAPKAS